MWKTPFHSFHMHVIFLCVSVNQIYPVRVLTSIYSHEKILKDNTSIWLLIKLPRKKKLLSSEEMKQYPVYFISSITCLFSTNWDVRFFSLFFSRGSFNLDRHFIPLFLCRGVFFFLSFRNKCDSRLVYAYTCLIRLQGERSWNIHKNVLFVCVSELKRKSLHSRFLQFHIVKLVFITELSFSK